MTIERLHAVPDQPEPADLPEPADGEEMVAEPEPRRRFPAPHVMAEQAVLGAMLLSADAIPAVTAKISTDSFEQPKHGTIFDTILDLYGRGEPVDMLTVASALVDSGELNRAGGVGYLDTCIQTVPTAANAGYYAGQVADAAAHRHATQLGGQIVQAAGNPSRSGAELRDVVARLYTAFADSTTTASPLVRVADLTGEAIELIQANNDDKAPRRTVPTGLHDLDRLTGGFQAGQLIVVAGRPGMGKSVCALGFARAAAADGQPALYFSLEMDRMELMLRIISAESGVPHYYLTQGGLDELDWHRVTRILPKLEDMPLHICDERSITPHQMHAMARQHQTRHGLGLVAVDYVQLMTSGRRIESRQQEVSDLSRTLKMSAGDLGVPLIAVAQLNRGPANRADRRPMMSDLRESGSLEQDPDIIILLHRDEYYDKECDRAGEIDLIVAKHRGGAEDTITCAAQLHLARIMSVAI